MFRPPALLAALCGILLVARSLAADPGAAARPSPTLRPSDVVFMYDDSKMYEIYGCTVLGWAGRGDPEHVAAAHAKGVRLFSTSVGFLTEWSRVIDFTPDFMDAACRNFAGEPFVVPWLWDHKYKGQPAWWWCTNSPLYRQYLESRLEQVAKAGVDGLHIDDYRGTSGSVTWLSSGFCRHCMAAFRRYLAENVPKEKLAELGIPDLSTFDYRQFLLDRGVKPEEYKSRRPSLPLADEFHDFHVKVNTAFVAAYRRRAEELRGKPLTLSVNSGLNDAQALAIAPHVSYFCCEVGHGASACKTPSHPVYIYKLADGLNRPVASTASGQDWAFINETGRTCLVRTWIAHSYAFGHNFMAPHRQWCYTQEKGTHWYQGPSEAYAYVYQFVRRNARLLDGYEAVAPVAVVYDNAARRKYRGNIEPICIALASRNIPFTVVVAGDNWLDYRLDGQRLNRFKAVVVSKDLAMDAEQKRLIDQVAAKGRLIVWPDDRLLEKLVPAPVVVEGSEQIWAVPRAVPEDSKAPVVVHLLNRQYAGDEDAMVAQKGFVVRLRRDLFGGRVFTKATLHAPKEPPRSVEVTSDGDDTIIKIPSLTLWALLELS